MHESHGRGVLLVAVALGILVLTGAVAGDSAYSLSGTPSIETPTRNVSFEGQQYTLDSLSRISPADSVTITTDVPDGAAYELNLRGPENQLISSERLTGDASYTFEYFGSGEAGTYAATIQDGGNTVAVHPIVIAGYDITVTPPGGVDAGENVTIEATVTERAIDRHSSLDSVRVVVGNADVAVQRPMTATGDGYEATISTAGLDGTTYNVYVVARGDETVRQQAEILGVSDTVELTVQGTATGTRPSPAESADTTPDSQSTGTTDSGVIDPSTPASETTGGSGDGFTLGTVVAALVGVGLWRGRARS